MFKKSTATDPDALSNLGVALGNDGNREGAMAAFKRAIALDPKHTQALTNLAGALNERGEHEQSEWRRYAQVLNAVRRNDLHRTARILGDVRVP